MYPSASPRQNIQNLPLSQYLPNVHQKIHGIRYEKSRIKRRLSNTVEVNTILSIHLYSYKQHVIKSRILQQQL